MTWDEWTREVEVRDLMGKEVCAYCQHASVEDFIPSPKMCCLRDDMKRYRHVMIDGTCEHYKRFNEAGGLAGGW